MTWTPAGPTPPGSYIQQELEDQKMSQVRLAEIVDMSPSIINEMISGKRAITAEAALAFEAALGLGAEFLLGLQSQYDLDKARLYGGTDRTTALRKQLLEYVPLKEFLDRGILDGSNGMESVVNQVKLLFGVPRLEDIDSMVYPAHFRLGFGDANRIPTRAYVVVVRSLARRMEPLSTVWTGSADQRASLWAGLEPLMESESGAGAVSDVLSNHGIRLIVESKFKHSRVEGVSMNVDGNPVIGLSLRHKRIDSFWFTLAHELAHLELGHLSENDALDLTYESPEQNVSEEEDAANRRAAEALVPNSILGSIPHAYISRDHILSAARRGRRHPGLIVGRLQHMGRLPYSHLKEYLVKVDQYLLPSAES